MNRIRRFIRFEELHFCKEDKVRYRKHLTFGVILGTTCGVIGTIYGIVWLLHISTAVNSVTAFIWIWE